MSYRTSSLYIPVVSIRKPQVESAGMGALEDHGFSRDPVIEAYKRDVDRTLIRENLKLTVQERFDRLIELARFAEEMAAAGERARDDG